MTKKIICILLTLGMAVSLPAAAANLEKSPYADVAESDWFFSYVSDLSRDGVIGGYPDGTFRPENPVTCGEALKLIFLAAGYGSQTPANGHWAGGYLNYALSKGIAGAEAVTDLDAPVSRLNIARIAATALCLSDSDGESPFSDSPTQKWFPFTNPASWKEPRRMEPGCFIPMRASSVRKSAPLYGGSTTKVSRPNRSSAACIGWTY
jgi:hypothetical protein